jgi:mannose-1-phosphate guanylyltransferase
LQFWICAKPKIDLSNRAVLNDRHPGWVGRRPKSTPHFGEEGFSTPSLAMSETSDACRQSFCRLLIPIILCGGAGSRLWPASRELHPKPFIRLPDGQSFLQKAFLRGACLPGVAEILTVTSRELLFKSEDEFRSVNSTRITTSFILEPFGRNTAAAIATASLHVAEKHGDGAIMLVLPADHLIVDQLAFQHAVHRATELAVNGKLVTFGIKPDAPETGYGYIEADGNTVLRFIEKPPIEKVKEYLASGRFLWNSGIFCFTAGTMLEEMEKYCPTILADIRTCVDQSRLTTGDGFSQLEIDANSFKCVAENSIDYAVMEKSDQVAVIPCNIGWNDIGSWAALGNLDAADINGNRIQGEVLLHNTRNCTIQSNGRLIGTVGVENLMVIDTPDALLVVDKASVQEVKHIYAELKTRGHDAHKFHRTVQRPWGTYTVLEEGSGFKIKRIEINSGASISLQRHQRRSEHWVVIRGFANVCVGGDEKVINTNESIFVPVGQVHRLMNPGDIACEIIEIQCGECVDEDDIERFDDIYGRCGK